LRAKFHTSPAWIEELAPAWNDLARDSTVLTPFQSIGWQKAWWEEYGAGWRPAVLSIWQGDDLVALWPLGFRGTLGRTLMPLASGVSDYLHPLVASGHEHNIWPEVEDALATVGANLVDLQQISSRFAPVHLLPGTMPQASCAVLELPSTFDDYLKRLSKSLRYDVRRIDRLKHVELLHADEANATDLLNGFFRLHSARWHSRGLPGAFASAKRRSFHFRCLDAALRDGTCRIAGLLADQRLVGVIYAMRAGNGYYFYQSGFDPNAKAYSPGTLLVSDSIKRAIEEGMGIFDFLRGVEPYKLRWQPQHVYDNVRWMWKTSGILGDLERRKRLLSHGIEAKLRQRFEGRGLK